MFALEGAVIILLVEAMHPARQKAQEARRTLRESEERYRLLVEGAEDYAVFLLDSQGCIANWKVGADRPFG